MNGFLPFKSQATTSTTTGESLSADPPPSRAAGDAPGASNALGLLGRFNQLLSRLETRDESDSSNASAVSSSEVKVDSHKTSTNKAKEDDNVALDSKEQLNDYKEDKDSTKAIKTSKDDQLDVFGENEAKAVAANASEENEKWEPLSAAKSTVDEQPTSSSLDNSTEEKTTPVVSEAVDDADVAPQPTAHAETEEAEHAIDPNNNDDDNEDKEDVNKGTKQETIDLNPPAQEESKSEDVVAAESTSKPVEQDEDKNGELKNHPADDEDELYNTSEKQDKAVEPEPQNTSSADIKHVSEDATLNEEINNDQTIKNDESKAPKDLQSIEKLSDIPESNEEITSSEAARSIPTILHHPAKDASMADFGVLKPQANEAPPPVPPKGNIKPRRKLQPRQSGPVDIPETSTSGRTSLVAPIDDLVGTSSSPALREIVIPTPTQNKEGKIPRGKSSQFDKRKPSVEIDALEQYQVSHRPFDFQVFLNHLRKKLADPLVRYIRLFLVNMSRQGHTLSASQRVKTVADFKVFINEKFALFEPFALMDERDRENLREGLEKLIMNRLYEHCFPPEVENRSQGRLIPHQYLEDLEADRKFSRQLEKYSWVNLTHLEVSLETTKELVEFTELAVTELNKLNRYRAPRDKIICILNACKIIFSFLKANNQELNADAFIPLLILIIFQAKTPNLISNIHYIQQYRSDEWLHRGETLYYLLSLEAAMLFITNLSLSDLTIDPKEYEAHMEAWEAEKTQKVHLVQPTPQRVPEERAGTSPSSVLLTSAEMFTKGISNLLTPSPPPPAPKDLDLEPVRPMPFDGPIPLLANEQQAQLQQPDTAELLLLLSEMFPSMDAAIITDLIHLNNGNMEACIDQCLAMVNEV